MPEKLFRILLLLLPANGRVVDKETFFSRVWPEESVSDGNLAQHIFLLRRFLGDEGVAHPYILTVPREGYRLTLRSSTIVRSDSDVLTDSAASLGGALLDNGFESAISLVDNARPFQCLRFVSASKRSSRRADIQFFRTSGRRRRICRFGNGHPATRDGAQRRGGRRPILSEAIRPVRRRPDRFAETRNRSGRTPR